MDQRHLYALSLNCLYKQGKSFPLLDELVGYCIKTGKCSLSLHVSHHFGFWETELNSRPSYHHKLGTLQTAFSLFISSAKGKEINKREKIRKEQAKLWLLEDDMIVFIENVWNLKLIPELINKLI